MRRPLWFFVDDSTPPSALQAAYQHSYDHLLVTARAHALLESCPIPSRMSVIVLVKSENEIKSALEHAAWRDQVVGVMADGPRMLATVLEAVVENQLKSGLLHRVDDEPTLSASLRYATQVDLLLLSFKDPTNIPLELVLAVTQPIDCQVVKLVSSASDGQSSAMTMECGADAIALQSNDIDEIIALDMAFSTASESQL
ncbi:MAG TPA: hypothetical protein EYO58_01190, partial [Flavobacteriales bacterium]|nr:hypothetical protein [Flavobacteriales bacterium]